MDGKAGNVKMEAGVSLKRQIGLLSAVNFMLSYVIGSGIFVTPGSVMAESGSVGMTLLIWILGGVISFLACLPFGELSTVVPKSGSIYIYLYTAFNERIPFFGGLVAFTFFWMMYIIILPTAAAVSALLFAEYMFVVVDQIAGEGTIPHESLIQSVVGAAAIVFIGILNCISVKMFVKAQDILSYLKIVAIFFIVGCGLYLYISGKALPFDPSFTGTNLSVIGISQALYHSLYSYDGGCFITNITEELKKPEKNILRSILIGLTITTLTYVLLNVAFLSTLTQAQIASGQTVITSFAQSLFGLPGTVIAAVIVCIALLSGIMSTNFYASRIGFVAAREGHLMEFLSCIHKTRHTPAPAVVAQVLLSLCFYFMSDSANSLIDIYAFFIWLAYGLTMVTVFVLRREMPKADRPFKVPWIVPVIVALISCGLFVISITSGNMTLILTFVVCIVLSTVFYFIFIYKELRFKSVSKFQHNLELMLNLVPPSEELIS